MEKLFVEKYRPSSIDEVIFQNDNVKKQFQAFVKAQEIPNLLLSGVQGTGKTSISRALVRDLNIDPADILTVNASDENSVDDMRNKIKNFAYSMPIGKFKVVQLEECDYLSHSGQSVLRVIIEDTSSITRFIATCNADNKISPAIKSRFQHFHFKSPDQDAVTLRVAEILTTEGITFDLDLLDQYVRAGYPDIRKTINLVQQFSVGNVLQPFAVSSADVDWKLKLISHLDSGDFRAVRKVVCENAAREEYDDVFRFMYDNVTKAKAFDTVQKQEQAIVTIAEHLYKHSLVADPEVNIAAMFISLGHI